MYPFTSQESPFLSRIALTQLATTCLKLAKETLKQGVKYVKVNNKDARTTPIVVLVSLLLTLKIFHTLL